MLKTKKQYLSTLMSNCRS